MEESTIPDDHDDDMPLSQLRAPIPRIPKADVEVGKKYSVFFHQHEPGKPFFITTCEGAELHQILETEALTKFEGSDKTTLMPRWLRCIRVMHCL